MSSGNVDNIFSRNYQTQQILNIMQGKVNKPIGSTTASSALSRKIDKDTLEKSGCTDGKDDGKISLGEKIKNFGKGIIAPITTMFKSPKNFLIGAGTIAGTGLLIAATGGAAAPVLVAAGAIGGGVQVGINAYRAKNAKTDLEAKNAWQGMGTGTTAVATSAIGAKSALKVSGTDTSKMGIIKSTLECIKQTPKSIKNTISGIKDGSFISNLKSIFNIKGNEVKKTDVNKKTDSVSAKAEAETTSAKTRKDSTSAKIKKQKKSAVKKEQPKETIKTDNTKTTKPNIDETLTGEEQYLEWNNPQKDTKPVDLDEFYQKALQNADDSQGFDSDAILDYLDDVHKKVQNSASKKAQQTAKTTDTGKTSFKKAAESEIDTSLSGEEQYLEWNNATKDTKPVDLDEFYQKALQNADDSQGFDSDAILDYLDDVHKKVQNSASKEAQHTAKTTDTGKTSIKKAAESDIDTSLSGEEQYLEWNNATKDTKPVDLDEFYQKALQNADESQGFDSDAILDYLDDVHKKVQESSKGKTPSKTEQATNISDTNKKLIENLNEMKKKTEADAAAVEKAPDIDEVAKAFLEKNGEVFDQQFGPSKPLNTATTSSIKLTDNPKEAKGGKFILSLEGIKKLFNLD